MLKLLDDHTFPKAVHVLAGEGPYPACYEAKVGVDDQQGLPLATFSIRARPALQTGCASFSLDLATAGKAFIPILTGEDHTHTSYALHHFMVTTAFPATYVHMYIRAIPPQWMRTRSRLCRFLPQGPSCAQGRENHFFDSLCAAWAHGAHVGRCM